MIKQPGYFIWNPKARFPQCCHATYRLALAEAERLARANPGHDFFIMAASDVIRVEPSPVSRLTPQPPALEFADDIPF